MTIDVGEGLFPRRGERGPERGFSLTKRGGYRTYMPQFTTFTLFMAHGNHDLHTRAPRESGRTARLGRPITVCSWSLLTSIFEAAATHSSVVLKESVGRGPPIVLVIGASMTKGGEALRAGGGGRGARHAAPPRHIHSFFFLSTGGGTARRFLPAEFFVGWMFFLCLVAAWSCRGHRSAVYGSAPHVLLPEGLTRPRPRNTARS